MSPSAIFTQNARSTSRRIGGRPGDLIAGLPVCVTNHPDCLPITHLHIKVLRRPLESGQFTSIRYGERLDELGAVPSIGSVGDSYDNALAEAVNALFKTELIRGPGQGPWRTVDDVELATLGWVYWWNTQRIHSYLGDTSPDDFETAYTARNTDHNTTENQNTHPAQNPG